MGLAPVIRDRVAFMAAPWERGRQRALLDYSPAALGFEIVKDEEEDK